MNQNNFISFNEFKLQWNNFNSINILLSDGNVDSALEPSSEMIYIASYIKCYFNYFGFKCSGFNSLFRSRHQFNLESDLILEFRHEIGKCHFSLKIPLNENSKTSKDDMISVKLIRMGFELRSILTTCDDSDRDIFKLFSELEFLFLKETDFNVSFQVPEAVLGEYSNLTTYIEDQTKRMNNSLNNEINKQKYFTEVFSSALKTCKPDISGMVAADLKQSHEKELDLMADLLIGGEF